MSGPSAKSNLQKYDSPEIASHYASLHYLTPCERFLFDSYIKPGSAILDLGVGGGRTTPYLADLASHYVGVDYAASMIEACRNKFPNLQFNVADAADLSTFPDGAFDGVVFAFNGIDYVLPGESRARCLEHIHRVLKADGCVIFSSHNPRAVMVRPSWNRERVRRVARRYSGGSALLSRLLLAALASARATLALGTSVWRSLSRVLQRVPTHAFWRGGGNFVDSAHSGLLTHAWTPERAVLDLEGFHFRLERALPNDYPQIARRYATDWYYYVFTKR
jgi:SAM-dependent methyltransferase